MTDADSEIIRLLTEMRDLQREELAYRRHVLNESMAAQQEGLSLQEVAIEQQKLAMERQEQAIAAQRFGIGATALLILVLGLIAFALLSK